MPIFSGSTMVRCKKRGAESTEFEDLVAFYLPYSPHPDRYGFKLYQFLRDLNCKSAGKLATELITFMETKNQIFGELEITPNVFGCGDQRGDYTYEINCERSLFSCSAEFQVNINVTVPTDFETHNGPYERAFSGNLTEYGDWLKSHHGMKECTDCHSIIIPD